MNAAALLTGQGWLGPGHALDARLTDYGAPKYKQKGKRGLAFDGNPATEQSVTGNGLVKPLLVSQRTGRHGIGKKAHEPQAGNQWWMKGFQTALNNIGKSESERTSAANSGTSTPYGYTGKHGGLYGYFVAGQMMKGTLEEWSAAQQDQRQSKKRKSDVLEEDPLAVKPVKKVQTAHDLESSMAYLAERDKARRKRHERAQSTDIDQFAAVGQFLGVVSEDPGKKKKQKDNQANVAVSEIEQPDREESKEERRARRKRRKDEKQKLTLAQMVEEELARLNSVSNSEVNSAIEDSTERTKRKVLRK